ncbi:hypothetical protein E4T45_09908 [Aureobasidium sp. EXF-8846]|nr:hypothetical protein E4T45_09908 [Aureobasidium sp. EXF-8846]
MHSSNSGSQSKPPSKHASRALSCSVSTLPAAQLERKRANDREIQRAIRQRTKDYIENLERRISTLTSTQDAREKYYLTTQQRHRELEEENIHLRSRLSGKSFISNVNENDDTGPPQYSVSAPDSLPQVQMSTGVDIPRPSTSATSRSISNPTEAWRQHEQYSSGSLLHSASFMPEGAQHAAGLNAVSWRPRDVLSASSYDYQVRQNDQSIIYPFPAHQMTCPSHSQAARFQNSISAQAPARSSVMPAYHNAGIGTHPNFQSMPQYVASSYAAYPDQQSHASFVPGASPVSSVPFDLYDAPRSLAPPAHDPNIGSAHFMPEQPPNAHTQLMGYHESTTQHAYGYNT